MAQRLIPGVGYVDETGSGQRLIPGVGYVNESQSGVTTTIVTEPFINNTETGVLASTAVVWTWLPLGRIGTLASITPVDGTGTTDVDGTLTVEGLSAGAGILVVAVQNTDATDDDVFYHAGTVA